MAIAVESVRITPVPGHAYVYGFEPPVTNPVTVPSHMPKHEALVLSVIDIDNTSGSVTITSAVSLQPLPSVMMTW